MKQLNWQGKAGKGKDIYHLCFQGASVRCFEGVYALVGSRF